MKDIITFIVSESDNSVSFKKGELVTGKLPNGKTVTGKFIEIYGNGKFGAIKGDDGKEYGVNPNTIEKVVKDRKTRRTIDPEILKDRRSQKISELYRKRKEIERDMEDDLSDLGDDIYDGNNPRVKYWA